MAQPLPAGHPAALDRRLWLACASPLSRLPEVGSEVYYLPLGHAEHRDEVCATITLHPGADPQANQAPAALQHNADCIHVFPKVVTNGDAGKGRSFHVPIPCATGIFPALDDGRDDQYLYFSDLRGQVWRFRHKYTGFPGGRRKHLLTSGWNAFRKTKSLVAGDVLPFMRSRDRLLIALQRTQNPAPLVSLEDVMDAARLAADGNAFTVTWFPRLGPEFLVPREEVDAGLQAHWVPGMRVSIRTAVLRPETRG
ncbi:auxin response factor 13-like [Brachypodium distachyon]|uniref:auxin response factor 13-like n=1 Tax=Brachypodium distachyon TaxID=15368 RepID=UPI000D0E1F84|nr:auxin response factor 13-like [Brachypodium distachyon]|eukprot:XP_024314537.1 auxin response factor 13-like [Brachypodium distachyon]